MLKDKNKTSKSNEQYLEELRAFRSMLTPRGYVDNQEKREKNLEDIGRIREAISQKCTVTEEERARNLAYINYISNSVRRG